MRARLSLPLLALLSVLSVVTPISAQSTSTHNPTPQTQPREYKETVCGPRHLGRCFKDLGNDQIGIWTSPFRLRSRDALWLVPFAGATGAALHYDADAQQALGIDKGRIDTSNSIARFGSPYATLAAGGGLFLLGAISKNEKLSETGRLGAEAVIDASLVIGGLKLASNRERPDKGTGTGGFWPHGPDDYTASGAFPSGHAAASWAFARVIASEYPGVVPKLLAYGFATTISVARVTGRRHFPSDVLVGSTFGYLIGGYVYRHHGADAPEESIFLVPAADPGTRTYAIRSEFPLSQLIHPKRAFAHLLP